MRGSREKVGLRTNHRSTLVPIQALELPRLKLPLHAHLPAAFILFPQHRRMLLDEHVVSVGHRDPAGEDAIVGYGCEVGLFVVIRRDGLEVDACVGFS